MEEIGTGRKFSTKEAIYWSMASFGGALIQGIYAALLLIFITDYLGLVETEYIVVLMFSIYAIWNAINDPLFGILSDKTKSKKGRRIPFMRYTAPFLGIFFILVWLAPAGAGITVLFWWLLITTLLYDTAYTIIFLVFSALLPEITEDEIQRNKLNMFSSFFGLIGQILGFIIPELFRQGTDLLPLQLAMVAVGIIGVGLIMLTTYKFKERPEFTVVDEPLGMWDMIQNTFRRKSFDILAIANFMSIFLQSLILGSIFYLADYVVQTSSLILLIFLFIPLLIGIWITPKLIKKWGVVRSDQMLLLIGGVGLILLTFMPLNELIYLCIAIAAFGFVGPLVFTNVMFAQVADEDELKTGVRREAMFFGINALVTKPAQSLAAIVPTLLLAATGFIPRTLTGGVPRPDLQPPEAIIAIRIFIGLIPGIALLLEALILQFYPIKGEYWKEIQSQVLKLHDEKHKKLKEMERTGDRT
jgi:GPH family glycoside/pentoside/hexuronide:cation symporter